MPPHHRAGETTAGLPTDDVQAFVRRVLDREFGEPDDSEGLADFQRVGVTAVERALDVYGGALLADEVGLGKTHLACAVAADQEPVVVVAPAHLRAMWSRMCPAATVLSHAGLARADGLPAARLVIVDEAQRFTNPASARYRALAGGFPDARFLLVTATPLGMGRADLVALLRLFLPAGGLAPVLGDTLEHWVADPQADWSELLRTVLVRRSRAVLDAVFPAGIEVGHGRAPLHFPTTDRATQPWAPDPAAMAAITGLVEPLDAGPLGLPPGLARTLLLSRLESSVAAVDGTLGRFAGFLTRRIEARRAGADLDRESWRRFFGGLGVDLDRQTVLPFVFEPGVGTALPLAQLTGCLALIVQARQRLAMPDPKPLVLAALLDERPTLIFTRSSETAADLFECLRLRHPRVGIGLVRGDGGRIAGAATLVDPGEVLACCQPGHPAGHVRWLVTTDVLSEGANLQSFARVISYDIPWNPLRLVQRHGRVDRLGVGQRRVQVVALTPSGPLEDALRIVSRVSRRAAEVEEALGDSGALAGLLNAAIDSRSDTGPLDLAATAELRLRLLHQSLLGARAGGPRGLSLEGPAATLFLFDLGVVAPPLWCLVTPTGVATGRSSLTERLLDLTGAHAAHVAAPGDLRRALTVASARRRSLREVRARPHLHPVRSAAGRLLRDLSSRRPPRRGQPEFGAWVLLHAVTRRALAPAAAQRLARALDDGVQDLNVLAATLGPPRAPSASDDIELIGFVRWCPRASRPCSTRSSSQSPSIRLPSGRWSDNPRTDDQEDDQDHQDPKARRRTACARRGQEAEEEAQAGSGASEASRARRVREEDPRPLGDAGRS